MGVDRTWDALRQGRELAAQRHADVAWVRADLRRFSLSGAASDVIVSFYFREAALYPLIRESLRPGGLMFYETFTTEQLRFEDGPRSPAHLLEPGELLRMFGDWDVIFYREVWLERGIAALVARKPAVEG